MAAADEQLSPFWGLQFHAYGAPCAVNRLPANATAFAHRNTVWSLQAASNIHPNASAAQRADDLARFQKFHALASQILDSGACRCYPDIFLNSSSYMAAYYASNAARLCTVKRAIDPENAFQFEQSIPLTC